ncbi:MAG: SDR family oxidoreductase [Caldilineaceae bacterium]|nr:SDR family oxidoreductase [Caldilineaceae bacterium]
MMETSLFDLSGKVAVVTGAGANGGIGHAIALGFARYGADVFVSDIDEAGLKITVEEIRQLGRRVEMALCDISSPEQVGALFAAVDRTFGRVDILVNVPYAFPSRVHPDELLLDAWHKTLAVSLTGYFICTQQAIRRMLAQGDGAVINIGSIAGVSALGRGNLPYSVAKAGVGQMTKELAVEYAGQGIRVNAILPAQVLTPSFKKALLEDPRFSEKLQQRLLTGIPLNRLLEPEDFVGPAVFLCSQAAAAVTGVLLPVDGGNLALNAGGSHIWPVD